MSDDLNPVATIGDLRRLIDGLPDETPVWVHHGWDLPIVECGIDDEDGFLLFAADERVTAVSRAWYEKYVIDGLGGQRSGDPKDPDDHFKPTVDDLTGSDPGFTGGLEASEYVRRLRGDLPEQHDDSRTGE